MQLLVQATNASVRLGAQPWLEPKVFTGHSSKTGCSLFQTEKEDKKKTKKKTKQDKNS